MNPTRRDVIRTLTVCGALGLCPGELFADPPADRWVDLAAVTDFSKDGIFDQFARQRKLLIIRKGDKLIACSSLCTHKAAPLSKKDDHMRCAKHGSEFDAVPGQVTALPSGHDAWVVGDEPVIVIDWWGASNYAK